MHDLCKLCIQDATTVFTHLQCSAPSPSSAFGCLVSTFLLVQLGFGTPFLFTLELSGHFYKCKVHDYTQYTCFSVAGISYFWPTPGPMLPG